MKYITKGQEPQELLDFKAAENENWKPRYGDLTSEAKTALKASLMQEQGWICCYCERRLEDNDSHIEHLRPRSKPQFAAAELEYSNLLCSCQERLKPKEPRHCGTAKDDWYEETLMVSPLDQTCEDRFQFTADGGVYARQNGDVAAQKTIEALNLGIAKLQAMRAAAIEGLLDLMPADVTRYLRRDADGTFPPFFVAIRQVLGG